MKYFAYGTNLNLEIVEKKGLRLSNRQAAVLDGYKLVFNKKSIRYHLPEEIGFANLQPNSESMVEGGIYDISKDDIPQFDKVEKCPEHYRKLDIIVRVPNFHP